MTLDEFFQKLKEQNAVHQDYIVKLKYKYDYEDKYTIRNEILEYDPDANLLGDYIWLNDWNEGQTDVTVLRYIGVQDVNII